MDLSRLSLNTATAKHASLAECAEAAARAGLGGLGPWRDRIQEVGAERAATILRDAGLSASTLCRGGFLTGPTEADRQAALDENRRALDEAAAIGAPELVMVVGGLPTGPDGRPDKDVVATRERVAERLGDLVPHALDVGVRLALEPMHPLFTADRGVLTTLGQALDWAAPFPAEAVGVVVDTYHVWWDPQCRESIERAGAEGRISSYQVCDWILPLAANTLNSRGLMGEGFIDFATLTDWVRKAGYEGPVEVEIFNEDLWARPTEEIVAQVAGHYADEVAGHL